MRPSESRRPAVRWMDDPEDHDYPAAEDFLELLMSPATASALVEEMRKAPTIQKHAKDILRASRSPLLAQDDPHVASDLAKVKEGKRISPVLLVAGSPDLIIADGYHRVCAAYHLEPNTVVPCRLVWRRD